MNDEKEIEKYNSEQEKSNPVLVWGNYDTTTLQQLENLAIVKNEELLESAFKAIKRNYFEFDDVSGKKIFVSFKENHPDQGTRIIGRDSCQILFFPTDEISYLVKDLFPGGNPEIIVLEKQYFMLGYIFFLTVYEICYK